MRFALVALLCACISDPRGECTKDADCAGGAPGSFCADGICQGAPRGALEAVPARAFSRAETLHVRARVDRSHGTASARVVFGGTSVAAVREADGALGADVPLGLAPAGVEGAVPFSVELRDDLGHVTALPGSVQVDDKPPRITVDPPPSAPVLRGTQVPLRITVEDMSAVTIAGATRNADGSFAMSVDTRAAPSDAAVDDVAVVATDAVGNVSTAHAGVPVTRLKFAAQHPAQGSVFALVLSDNMIWTLVDPGEVWLLRRSDGATLVRAPQGGHALPQIATDGSRLFFGRADDMVCRMGADGAIQLCKGPFDALSGGPILQGTTAVFATAGTFNTSRRLFALGDDGNIVPTGATADFASPAISPGGVTFAGAPQAIVAALFDGLAWSQPKVTAETPYYLGAPAFRGNQVLLVSTTATLDTFTFLDPLGNPAPAPVTTQVATPGTPISSPTIAADGTAVLATDDHHLVALRPDNSVRWTVTLPSKASAPPSHGAGDLLYVGTITGQILALHLNDGSAAWTYDAGAPVRAPLAPGCDGVLYAAVDGAVLALVTDAAGLADSTWPRQSHDVRGTGDARRPLRSATGACLE